MPLKANREKRVTGGARFGWRPWTKLEPIVRNIVLKYQRLRE